MVKQYGSDVNSAFESRSADLMKDIDEVTRQKQSDLARVRKEVDALRIAIALIDEDGDAPGGHENEGGRGVA
jgi:hypothetical protein